MFLHEDDKLFLLEIQFASDPPLGWDDCLGNSQMVIDGFAGQGSIGEILGPVVIPTELGPRRVLNFHAAAIIDGDMGGFVVDRLRPKGNRVFSSWVDYLENGGFIFEYR